jgi:glucan phosphoethanolaminetransferase (alkaline phosphatase superfamily)
MLGAYGTDYLRFIPASLLSLVCTPSRPDRRYAEIAKAGSRFVIGAGVTFSLMGIMTMLRHLFGPFGLGMGLSVCMLTAFYAVLAAELFFAVVYKAFSSSGSEGSETSPLPMSNVLIPIIICGLVIGMFFILLQGFSSSWEPEYRRPTPEVNYGTPELRRYRIHDPG